MKIGIMGCSGRMGRELLQEVIIHDNCTLLGGVEHKGSPYIGHDISQLIHCDNTGIIVSDDSVKLFEQSDAVIDFSSPQNTIACAEIAASLGKIHVIGTTGLSDKQKSVLEGHAKTAVIVYSANMSVGVNLVLGLVEEAARIMHDDYDIEIVEMHHRHKMDAPSGTALALGEAAAKGRKVDLKNVSTLSREGITGGRKVGTIGFAALRGGDVIGDHTVIFAGEGERIEITHKSSNRKIYARGAIRAALWAKKKTPGLYGMKDVLGLKNNN